METSERRTLPRTGLRVPVFGLGCAQLGGLYRAMSDDDAALLIDAAWQRGVRMFDTAPYYGHTRSERRLADALAQRPRGEYVLSSKVGRLMRPAPNIGAVENGFVDPLPWRPEYDYSRDGVLRSFDDSLRRLRVSRLDIVYVHDIGPATHGAQHATYWRQLTRGGGFRALEELRASGAAGAIGLGVNEWQVAHAAMDEIALDCTMLAGRYTLLEQGALVPFLSACARRGHAVIVAGPFNSGALAGAATFDYAPMPDGVRERVQALQRLCDAHGVALAAAALQFPLAHPAVVACVAGAHAPDEVAQNVARLAVRLPGAFWRALRASGLIDERAPLPD